MTNATDAYNTKKWKILMILSAYAILLGEISYGLVTGILSLMQHPGNISMAMRGTEQWRVIPALALIFLFTKWSKIAKRILILYAIAYIVFFWVAFVFSPIFFVKIWATFAIAVLLSAGYFLLLNKDVNAYLVHKRQKNSTNVIIAPRFHIGWIVAIIAVINVNIVVLSQVVGRNQDLGSLVSSMINEEWNNTTFNDDGSVNEETYEAIKNQNFQSNVAKTIQNLTLQTLDLEKQYAEKVGQLYYKLEVGNYKNPKEIKEVIYNINDFDKTDQRYRSSAMAIYDELLKVTNDKSTQECGIIRKRNESIKIIDLNELYDQYLLKFYQYLLDNQKYINIEGEIVTFTTQDKQEEYEVLKEEGNKILINSYNAYQDKQEKFNKCTKKAIEMFTEN